LRPVILAGLDRTALDDLKLANVLDKEEPPSFGHPTRRDAARIFLDRNRPQAVRAEAEVLIFALAQSINAIDSSAIPYLSALAGIRDTVREQDLDPLPLALSEDDHAGGGGIGRCLLHVLPGLGAQ
jgi:hypothetical protein